MSVVIKCCGEKIKALRKGHRGMRLGGSGKVDVALGEVVKESLFDKVTFGQWYGGSEG